MVLHIQMVKHYSLIVSQSVALGGIAGSPSASLTIATAGISSATGNYIQVTGITTGTDSYHRITSINTKNKLQLLNLLLILY